MQMTDGEILASYKQATKPHKQIGILAELNACSRETIIEVLRSNGVPESELPKKRGPKPNQQKEVKTCKTEAPQVEVLQGDIITGKEVDLGIDEVCPVVAYRPIESILLTGPRDEMEERRVERYNAIPEAVKGLCRTEIVNLFEEILALEKRRDSLINFMNGEVVCQK